MADFNSVLLGNLLGGWHHKDNQAAEYKSSNSNYRVYKPEVSPTAEGGLFISCTMDHIRGGAKDDHAFIKLNLDNNCKPYDINVVMRFAGKPEINTGLLTAASTLGGIAGHPELTAAAIFAQLAIEVGTNLYDSALKLADSGGRKNFLPQVQHTVNRIGQCASV